MTNIQRSIHYALQCATATTQIKLLTLTHCSAYASYATCTSSAGTAMEQPSHPPVPVLADHTRLQLDWKI